MAPLVPRMHVFEFADMPWFPPFLRAYMQAALTATWTTHVPLLQTSSPAQIVAHLLRTHLGPTLHSHIFIDFCAGGGGPTPSIERHLNTTTPTTTTTAKTQTNGTRASQDGGGGEEPLHFVLTDLHPHADMWAQAAAQAAAPGAISYVAEPVDAADVPRELIRRYTGGEKKVFRLFNLAFHHFDDGLARRILRDTVEGGGEGFGIFELQDRGIAGFVACCLLGVGIMILAPYYALLWGAPMALVFTYLLPILPAVLVFDGWMSCLRTRTPDEIEALLRTCGAEGGEEEIAKWEVMSGSEMFMWPVGYVDWVICVKRDGARRD
ncbi:hypothetical protein F5144DRAFT_615762 [Chaetomium tenue]|uniref:Uncharacterized protein n=1 Tax=Chaetomium tenue TaxID=1854479 RepID=A0ACB7NUT7_9PEZI|nr:hypothetical protein F5144DRAFT_615762 [Chaetomium globosum]